MKVNKNFVFLHGLFAGNVGIFFSGKEAALIDAGFVPESVDHIFEHLEEVMKGRTLKYVFVTHTDPDHIGGLARLKKEYNPQIVIHRAEVERLEKPPAPFAPAKADIIVDGDSQFAVGNMQIQLLFSPGHSKGFYCLYYEKEGLLFAGDTAFAGPPDNFYLPYTGRMYTIPPVRDSLKLFLKSLTRLQDLDPQWTFTGHGLPVRGGKKRIGEHITDVKNYIEKGYTLFKDELSVSELADRLEAFPVRGFGLAATLPVAMGVSHHLQFAEKVIEDLLSDNRIAPMGKKIIQQEAFGQKCIREEPCYKRK
jgi:glyoxylase-like metal-dependent hydrolase (beta-lactamase superfamily II)